MNGKKSARIHFVTALIVAIVATAVAFTLFFISGENGIYSKISAENSSQNEQPPQADVPALSEFKTVEEMQQAIDKYTQYLASDLLELVNNENAVREKDLDLISVSGFSDIKLEREAAEKLNAFIAQAKQDGYTNDEMAEQKTLRSEAKPGYSEYQTGLAVSIGETSSTEISVVKNSSFYKYATENIWKYGFILSYPEDKTAVTGHSEQAQFIMKNGMCLEEYRDYLTSRIETLKKNIEDENSKKIGTYNK